MTESGTRIRRITNNQTKTTTIQSTQHSYFVLYRDVVAIVRAADRRRAHVFRGRRRGERLWLRPRRILVDMGIGSVICLRLIQILNLSSAKNRGRGFCVDWAVWVVSREGGGHFFTFLALFRWATIECVVVYSVVVRLGRDGVVKIGFLFCLRLNLEQDMQILTQRASLLKFERVGENWKFRKCQRPFTHLLLHIYALSQKYKSKQKIRSKKA